MNLFACPRSQTMEVGRNMDLPLDQNADVHRAQSNWRNRDVQQ